MAVAVPERSGVTVPDAVGVAVSEEVSVGVGERTGVEVAPLVDVCTGVGLRAAVGGRGVSEPDICSVGDSSVGEGDAARGGVDVGVDEGLWTSREQPFSALLTADTSISTATSLGYAVQLSGGAAPKAMLTPAISSSTVTAPSAPQSPVHGTAGEAAAFSTARTEATSTVGHGRAGGR